MAEAKRPSPLALVMRVKLDACGGLAEVRLPYGLAE